MKHLATLFLILFISAPCFSQNENSKIKKLKSTLDTLTSSLDSTDTYQRIGYQFIFNNPDSAKFYTAIAMNRAELLRDTYHIAFCHNNLAVLNTIGLNFPEASFNYRKGIYFLNRIGEQRQASNLLGNLAIMFEYKSELDSAIFYNEKAMEIEVKENNLPGISKIHINNGRLYQNKGFYNVAMNLYFKALKNYALSDVNIEQKRGIASCNYNISNCFFELNDLEKAANFCQKSLDIYTEIDDKRGIAGALLILGNLKFKAEKNEAALPLLEESFRVAESVNELNIMSENLDSRATIYLNSGNLEAAEKYGLEGLAIAEKGEYFGVQTYLNKTLSDIYSEKNNSSKAIKFAQKALKSGEKAEMIKVVPEVYKNLADIYKKNGHCKKAIVNLEMHSTAKDSFLNNEKQKAIAELEIQYQSEQKEKENQLLSAENQIQTANLATARQRQIGFGLLSLGLLFGLLIFLFLNRKLKKERDEKADLLSNMFHNVKNSLDQLAAIFGSQNRRLAEGSAAKGVLKEGQLRVETIKALNEQLLMDESGQPTVKLKDYMESLTRNVEGVFRKPGNNIQINSEIENLRVNYKVATSLGLVTNELMTNAFKYAFDDGHADPTIDIQISAEGKALKLSFSDNGKGFNPKLLNEENKSFGMNLIHNFLENVGAKMKTTGIDGAKFDIQIPTYN